MSKQSKIDRVKGADVVDKIVRRINTQYELSDEFISRYRNILSEIFVRYDFVSKYPYVDFKKSIKLEREYCAGRFFRADISLDEIHAIEKIKELQLQLEKLKQEHEHRSLDTNNDIQTHQVNFFKGLSRHIVNKILDCLPFKDYIRLSRTYPKTLGINRTKKYLLGEDALEFDFYTIEFYQQILNRTQVQNDEESSSESDIIDIDDPIYYLPCRAFIETCYKHKKDPRSFKKSDDGYSSIQFISNVFYEDFSSLLEYYTDQYHRFGPILCTNCGGLGHEEYDNECLYHCKDLWEESRYKRRTMCIVERIDTLQKHLMHLKTVCKMCEKYARAPTCILSACFKCCNSSLCTYHPKCPNCVKLISRKKICVYKYCKYCCKVRDCKKHFKKTNSKKKKNL